MSKKKYLDFYYQCMKSKRLTDCGLCNCFPGQLWVFYPSNNNYGPAFWAYEGRSENLFTVSRSFNRLRQNIVLFLAAMNNEL